LTGGGGAGLEEKRGGVREFSGRRRLHEKDTGSGRSHRACLKEIGSPRATSGQRQPVVFYTKEASRNVSKTVGNHGAERIVIRKRDFRTGEKAGEEGPHWDSIGGATRGRFRVFSVQTFQDSQLGGICVLKRRDGAGIRERPLEEHKKKGVKSHGGNLLVAPSARGGGDRRHKELMGGAVWKGGSRFFSPPFLSILGSSFQEAKPRRGGERNNIGGESLHRKA